MKLFQRKPQPSASEPSRHRVLQRSELDRRASFTYYSNRSTTPPGAPGRDVAASRSRADVTPTPQSFWRRRSFLPWFGIAMGIVIVGWLTFLDTSSTVVMIDSSGTLSSATSARYEETVDELLRQSILSRNKLTVNATGIARELQKRHPEIEHAALVVPIFGSQPRMYIGLSEPAFVLQSGGQRYVLSSSGYIIGTATGSTKLPLIIDDTGETVTVSRQLLPASHVTFLQTVDYQLTHKGLSVESFTLPKSSAYEADARLKDTTFIIRFNLAEDATVQSGAVVATLGQLGSATPSTYLDVRVPGRAYYK